MKLKSALLCLFSAAKLSFAAFGWTQSGNVITVDAGSTNTLVYKVDSTNCDITSIVFRGTDYQSTESKRSHISSGLGTATVSVTTVNSNVVKVTCVTSTLTHYYVTRSGESIIYMATYITAEPTIGELRYIARLNAALLTVGQPGSYTNLGTAGTVEGSDVFYASNGYTYSKFYSSKKFIDDSVHYISGNDVTVAMVVPRLYAGYESSSGGPFHRDIDSDRSSVTHAFYFYMNSGHAQTEANRMGLHGPYALSFSRSGVPSVDLDTTFFSILGITGYVTQAQRGLVTGTASGISNSYSRVVHWYNTAAQYWVYVQSNDLFYSPRMKPGTYKLYRDEFEVASKSVTVSAGVTTTASIASTEPAYNYAWTIGDFDGKPTGFQNADKQETMHPSDTRMSAWTAKTYTVGSTSLSGFPMAQIKALNNPTTIKFTLNSSQLGAATLRIATLRSFAGGRPAITVNGWAGPGWGANGDSDSRGFTRGTYHGLNTLYTASIPSDTLVSGTNTILINVISGSGGDGFLSPNFIYDAIGLVTGGSTAATTAATTAAGTTTKAATTTTTTKATTTTASSSGTVPVYGQCGGSGYSGSTTCASGSTCVYSNEWYSQCLPS